MSRERYQHESRWQAEQSAWLDSDVWLEASATQSTLASQMWCVHAGVAPVVRCYRDTSASLVGCLHL
jgi:hypothetical protein